MLPQINCTEGPLLKVWHQDAPAHYDLCGMDIKYIFNELVCAHRRYDAVSRRQVPQGRGWQGHDVSGRLFGSLPPPPTPSHSAVSPLQAIRLGSVVRMQMASSGNNIKQVQVKMQDIKKEDNKKGDNKLQDIKKEDNKLPKEPKEFIIETKFDGAVRWGVVRCGAVGCGGVRCVGVQGCKGARGQVVRMV